jgi:hypothetical protein
MTRPSPRFLALLRGINVGGKRDFLDSVTAASIQDNDDETRRHRCLSARDGSESQYRLQVARTLRRDIAATRASSVA